MASCVTMGQFRTTDTNIGIQKKTKCKQKGGGKISKTVFDSEKKSSQSEVKLVNDLKEKTFSPSLENTNGNKTRHRIPSLRYIRSDDVAKDCERLSVLNGTSSDTNVNQRITTPRRLQDHLSLSQEVLCGTSANCSPRIIGEVSSLSESNFDFITERYFEDKCKEVQSTKEPLCSEKESSKKVPMLSTIDICENFDLEAETYSAECNSETKMKPDFVNYSRYGLCFSQPNRKDVEPKKPSVKPFVGLFSRKPVTLSLNNRHQTMPNLCIPEIRMTADKLARVYNTLPDLTLTGTTVLVKSNTRSFDSKPLVSSGEKTCLPSCGCDARNTKYCILESVADKEISERKTSKQFSWVPFGISTANSSSSPSVPYSTADILYNGETTRSSMTDDYSPNDLVYSDKVSGRLKENSDNRRPNSRNTSRRSISLEKVSINGDREDLQPIKSSTISKQNHFRPTGIRQSYLRGEQFYNNNNTPSKTVLNSSSGNGGVQKEDLVAMGTLWNPNTPKSNGVAVSNSKQYPNAGSSTLPPRRGGPTTSRFTMGTGSSRQPARDVEPKYTDPAMGSTNSFQQRLIDLSALEAETVRWERSKKVKKKPKQDRDS